MKSIRFLPLFVACSVVLIALPQAALARVVARPIAGFANGSAGAAVLGGVSRVPTLAPLTTIAPALTPLFAAPAAARTLLPALAAASVTQNTDVAALATVIRTPGAAAIGIPVEAATYTGAAAYPAGLAASEDQPVQEKARPISIVASVSHIVRDGGTSEMFTGGVRGQGALAVTELAAADGTNLGARPTMPGVRADSTVTDAAYASLLQRFNNDVPPQKPGTGRSNDPESPRDLSMKEFHLLNLAGIAGSILAGVLLHNFWIGLLGMYVAAIPLIYAYVGIRRLLGDNLKVPGVRFAPSVSWAGKQYSLLPPKN
ncbi:MAG: hypothetical protein HY549_01335 [Elusimicrobia bacterium]|nr:hypothetical protein [Elusimicrobiota bacterium]